MSANPPDESPDRGGFSLGTVIDLARNTVPPMHPGGRPIVLGFAFGAVALRLLSRRLGLLGFIATAWCAWFFREPKRVTPTRPRVAVAPADGTVADVVRALPPAELGLPAVPMTRISTFLTIFDIHVQRAPAHGEVRTIAYRPGKFLSANLDKASEDNERSAMVVRTVDGHDLVVVQIAGLVARRIVCSVQEGDKVAAGQTYGLIRFGSRVDLYVPIDSRVLVEPGQRTVGGETVLVELPDVEV
ncbi:MAG: phosphatidylserine decarboxylase [Kutzneria sp.]|nr:phosphatidylserine decarboxylase [Kutzneria sp.]MBV9846773.1 phosphatidylserine decarboxylase [Kutzneria sp.]